MNDERYGGFSLKGRKRTKVERRRRRRGSAKTWYTLGGIGLDSRDGDS
jgi:hypothetical protein